MKTLSAVFAALVLASSAQGQEAPPPPPPSPEEIAAIRAHNQEIVARNPNADGIFAVQDDGTIKHLQSGLLCPASFPNVRFFHAMVFPAPGKGHDVGCDYGRANERGGANAKLTIFAVKAAEGTTLDAAFAGYQREVVQSYQNVRAQGPVLTVTENESQTPLDFRSEGYLVTLNQRDYSSELIVAISAGWIIEVRSTYVGKSREILFNEGDGPDVLAATLGDRVMSATALFSALGTVGK